MPVSATETFSSGCQATSIKTKAKKKKTRPVVHAVQMKGCMFPAACRRVERRAAADEVTTGRKDVKATQTVRTRTICGEGDVAE